MHNFTVSNFSRYALNTYMRSYIAKFDIIDENLTIERHAGGWEEEKVGVWQKT